MKIFPKRTEQETQKTSLAATYTISKLMKSTPKSTSETLGNYSNGNDSSLKTCK
jgi:hypothetical protein